MMAHPRVTKAWWMSSRISPADAQASEPVQQGERASSPVDRGRTGSKHHVIIEAHGSAQGRKASALANVARALAQIDPDHADQFAAESAEHCLCWRSCV